MTVVALVLASGRGTRIGGPKALIAWQHDGATIPLALAHARTRLAAESDRAVIVTRNDIAAALTSEMGRAPEAAEVELVVSRAPDEQGAAGSIAAAMRSLDLTGDELVLLTPVDCPPASNATAEQLLEQLRRDERLLAARPKHGDRRGHPVALRLAALEPYARGRTPPLRDRLRELVNAVVDVPVDDPRVLADIDTAQDFAQYSDGALSFIGLPR